MHDVANAIAKAHILPYNAKFEFTSLNKEQTKFLCVVSHPTLNANIEENINTYGLPFDIAEEYVHCRVHGIAAKLLSKLYPEK